MRPSINLRYKSLLLTCLLILSAGAVAPAWGQQYTIIPSTQTKVTERVDTVYVKDGVERELFVPELRNNDGGNVDSRYKWYVRWYLGNGKDVSSSLKSTPVDVTTDKLVKGGTAKVGFHNASLKLANNGKSLFWYDGFYKEFTSTATGASTVSYFSSKVEDGDIVVCDVSLNKVNVSGSTITEPVISMRYKFVIQRAENIAKRIAAMSGSPFIEENIWTSEGDENINVQLGMTANNYAWYKDGTTQIVVGDSYRYQINGGSYQTLKSWEQIIDSLKITNETTLQIWAINDTEISPLLYKYTLAPISGSGFMLEDSMLVQQQENRLDMRREPDKHKDVYEMIGYINFDRNDSITLSELMADKSKNIVSCSFAENASDKSKWLDPEVTGYAPYNYNTQYEQYSRIQTLQNQYGLFRTANLKDCSRDGLSFGNTNKYYWFVAKKYTNNDFKNSPEIYDRTYYNTDKKSLGYFFYVDAANLPGRLVKIKLDGIMCAHTGILVNFWVNDMTTRANETHSGSKGGKPLPPNINMNFIGRDNQGNDVVLHRFTSGDALTYYSMKDPYNVTTNISDNQPHSYETNEYIGKWQQLVYSFNLLGDLSNYKEFYLEVQNNTIHANGSDYAIDGLRIYRTKPQIDVKRVDVCSSANLTVATDYELLLKNMGWSINPDVLSDLNMGNEITEDSKHIWKYRYGLMGGDPTKRKDNLNKTIGNVYIGATDKKEKGNIKDPEDWITLNTDLKDYSNERYNNRSKVYRIIVPTKEGLKHQGFEDLTNYETAMRRQIVVNLRMVNDFLYDAAKRGVWDEDITAHAQQTNGESFPKEEYIAYLKQHLRDLCDKSEWDYKIPDPKDLENQIDQIMNGYDNRYEELIRAVCSVVGISRPRVPWWDEENSNTIHLSAIDVDKTELRYKGEKPYGSGTKVEPASGKYDVVIFSATATVTSNQGVDFPNASAGDSFQDPCLLTTPFTVLPSFTVVANTKSDLPEGMIACEGRISQIEKATVWVEQLDGDQNPTGELTEFEKIDAFKDHSYTFDWFLGDSLEFAAFHERHGVSLEEILSSYRNQLSNGNNALPFQAEALIEYCKNNDEYKALDLIEELKTLLLGDVDTEPKLVIGGKFGYAEFRWVKKVVAIPYLPESILEGEQRKWLFCDKPQEKVLEAAPAPKLLVGFPDVEYPEGMEHYPNVPLRIGLPNIVEGSIENIPIQGKGLTMGMKESNQLGLPDGNAKTIFLRQGQTYIEVGDLTALFAKAKTETETDNGGGLFSMTFKKDAYKEFAEGQIYSLYIPFGEYKDGNFVAGSCEGYATLLIKIVPEYLTWTGKNIGEDAAAWYNDANWQQSTKGELYIQTGASDEDANGNDDVTAAFAPLHFTRITIPGGQTLELEDLKEDKNLLQGIDTTSETKATQYIQYDMAVDKKEDNTIVAPYYINKVKAIYFKPEAQLRRQQFLTYDTARVEFEMTPDAKYWMASPLQSVFAGDMYTVKNTGRQNTYAFDDITYRTANNDRQAPAFYQKAWDKAITMYVPKSEVDPVDLNLILGNDELDKKNYEIVQSNWSREYNDVNVPYALGKGFYASVEKKNATGLGEKVLVRLPKADTEYKYEPLTKAMTKAPTLAERINAGKLADEKPIEVVLTDTNGTEEWWNTDNGTVRVIADGDGKHFLLGNPYMYPLDIVRFLKENEAILAQKYWTLDVKEGLVVGTPDVEWEGGNVTDATSGAVIAPMQAFFVELKDAAQTKAEGTATGTDLKVVHFDPSMMQGEPEKVSSSLRTATAKNPVLRLTAERDAYRSTALLTRQDDAANSYEADKDAVILLDTELEEIPQVYTIAGTRAVGVNVVRRIDQVPLGVYAGEGKGEVTLTIEGIGDWAETLYLYDAVTRKSTELSGDTYTLRLDGSSHGRYFLSAGSPTGNEGVDNVESISVYSAVSGRVVASASEALKRIQVFTPMGRLVRTLYPARPTYTFDLPAGIYIIRAEIARDQKTVKLRVQ
ncbi:hypothetical protein [Parabacteroides distasonis]|uniref:T9SS type A sorting domain-containing protein n=1 Tax=Parabacteroides distasonis TaxID=823 RepID=A0A4S2ETM1_PARDI|nr:hypothetical protein [Parabacteroides distasonis]TGY57731.1 hypothetical protein E5342_09765 [Parabacteroides distasonis]